MPASSRSASSASSSNWSWLLAGVLLGALCVLALRLPARWVWPETTSTSSSSPHKLALTNVQGSLWQGQSQLALASAQHGWLPLPGLWRWKWHLGWSSGPELGATLESDCCLTGPLKASWRPFAQGQWVIEPIQAQLDVGWLQSLGSPWNTLGLLALVQVNSPQLSGRLDWEGLRIEQGRVDVKIVNLSSALSPIQPLGRYHVDIAFQPEPRLTIQTESGPLLLSGQGEWTEQRLRFRGLAKAEASHAQALQPLLSVLGQRQGTQAELNF